MGDIAATYRGSTETDPTIVPLGWEKSAVLRYVRTVVHNVVGRELSDDAHILDEGKISDVKTMEIRTSLIRAIPQSFRCSEENIPHNIVSANPSIARLAKRFRLIVNARSGISEGLSAAKLQQMEAMVSEFSTSFPQHRPATNQRLFSGEVILLTGTTGAIGSQLLAYLASSPEVLHVFALNRKSRDGRTLRARQAEAFSQRGLQISIVDSPNITLLEGNTEVQDLGIDPLLFNKIRDNITLVMHNAWRVNLLSGLSQFRDNIKGVRTMIDLALGSPQRNPPRIMFMGSVLVFTNWNAEHGPPLETAVKDPNLVTGSGYAESKYVAERILENAAKSTRLRPIIVRIGQLTGTACGAWNYGDWPPSIVASGQKVGALPIRNDCVAWLPLDTAARALFEFRSSESQYLHLVHPKPVPWNTVFKVFASQLNLPLVSWEEWEAKLEEKEGGDKVLRMRDVFNRFWSDSAGKNREAPGLPLLDIQQALRASPSLANPLLSRVDQKEAERWVHHWQNIGFLPRNASKL